MKTFAKLFQVLHQTKRLADPQFQWQHTRTLVLLLTQLHHPELGQLSGVLCTACHHVENQRVKVMSCSWDGGFW